MYSWAHFRFSWNSIICNGDHLLGRDLRPASQSCLHEDIIRKQKTINAHHHFQLNQHTAHRWNAIHIRILYVIERTYLFGQTDGHNRIIPCMKDKGGALDASDVNVAVKCHVVTWQPLGEKPVDDGQRPIELHSNSMKRIIRSTFYCVIHRSRH